MRRKRIRVRGQRAYYHSISRIVAGDFLLGSEEKEVFVRILRQTAEFSGVELVTYAVLDNHFHVLLSVPPATEVPDDVLLQRYRRLYHDDTSPHQPKAEVMAGILEAGGVEADRWRKRLHRRMHDVSEFMKVLKLRYSIWFNKTHQRFGTLWSERFRSILVEGSAHALSTVAAYIDLNSVRAGLVEDPAHYRWCGYAAAVAGNSACRAGICATLLLDPGDWTRAAARYRLILFGKGSAVRSGGKQISPAEAEKVYREGGVIPLPELLRLRIRSFSQGVALGSARFLRELSLSSAGPTGAGRDGGSLGPEISGLQTLRRLRGSPFQSSGSTPPPPPRQRLEPRS